jgi:Uma2 family endonuclease
MTSALLDPVAPEDAYEVIDGEYKEWPAMSVESIGVVSLLAHLMMTVSRDTLGHSISEMLIKLKLPTKSCDRRPDVIFVPYSAWPKGKALPRTHAWAITPTICVEVVSPNDEAEELMTKVTEYLDAGVAQVWVIYPVTRAAVVHDATGPARLLRAADTLDGGPILPGFAVKLADLIPEPDAA